MLAPIITAIEVPCGPEEAFTVFPAGMVGWWPLHKRSVSVLEGRTASALRVDASLGGEIVEVDDQGGEHLWGTITTYDPPAFVALDFHIGMPPENASLVEVRFSALADERTRVVLTQSNWEAFGDLAEAMRRGYGSSWVMIFEEAYRSAWGA